MHIYGLGALFLLVAIYSSFSIAQLVYKTDIRRKKVHIVNWVLLSIFGLSRGLFLIIDAYHSSNVLPVVAVKLLWGIGQPCIITAYVLVFIVLKNALVMKQRFRSWYTTKNIAMITLPYFVFVLTAEMTVSFVKSLNGLTFACQLLYVLFTVFLLLFYSSVALKIWKKKRDVSLGGSVGQQQRSRLNSILVVCFSAIIGGVLLCVTQIYAMVGVYGVFSEVREVPPWPWYGFNTMQRILELYMCALLCKMLVSKSNGTNQHSDLSQNSSSVITTRNRDVMVTRQNIMVTNHTNQAWSPKPVATELAVIEN